MAWAILDTNVYIDHWERGLHEQEIEEIARTFVVRHSSVVLSELRRGARSLGARRLVESLHRLAKVRWAPTGEDWWEAGRLILRIGDANGWDTNKRREFQNDALIALTARGHGALVATTNRSDFSLLERFVAVPMIYL